MLLEAGSPRSRCQHGQVLVKALFWVADCRLLVVSLHGGRDKEALWRLFYEGTNPIHEGSIFMT